VYSNGEHIWIRVPKCGTTSYKRDKRPSYNAVTGRSDHLMWRNRGIVERWAERYAQLPVVVTIRHPYDWCYSMYNMCFRIPGHWSEYVTEALGHKRGKDDPVKFVHGLRYTPYDWFSDCDKVEVRRVEDLGLGRLNTTQDGARRPFDVTGDLLEAMQQRFSRELEHYP